MLAACHWLPTCLAVPKLFSYFYAAFAHRNAPQANPYRTRSLSDRRTVFPRRTASTFRNSHFDSARYVPPRIACLGGDSHPVDHRVFARRGPAWRQGMGRHSHARPPSMFGKKKETREISGPSLSATDEPVADIRVVGNSTIPTSQILNQLQTRIGRPFDPALVQRDVRKLAARGWFVDVQPTYEQAPNGRIVIFKVVERPVVRYVEYLGNYGLRTKKLDQGNRSQGRRPGRSVRRAGSQAQADRSLPSQRLQQRPSQHPRRRQADRPRHRLRDQRRHRAKDLEGRVRRQRVRQQPPAENEDRFQAAAR